MNLHNEIMNLPCTTIYVTDANLQLAYKIGHRDARHAAAELAVKAEYCIEKLEYELKLLKAAK